MLMREDLKDQDCVCEDLQPCCSYTTYGRCSPGRWVSEIASFSHGHFICSHYHFPPQGFHYTTLPIQVTGKMKYASSVTIASLLFTSALAAPVKRQSSGKS